MRLGILTQYYPPETGAPQARLHELAQLFVEAGHEVFVLTAMPSYPRGRLFDGYGGVYRCERIDGVQVQRALIYPTKSVRMLPRLANYFSFVASSLLTGALALPRVDVLLTESPPLFLGVAGWLLARLRGARLVFNVSDLWPQSAVRLGVIGPGPALRAAERLEAFLYRHAWLVSGQSREILEDIRRRFPAVATWHLPNGVDTRQFRPELRCDETRRHLAPASAECIAIYAGLHGVAQKLDQLLAAAAQLRDLRSLAFVLVGDGPEKERLAAEARARGLDNVRLLPAQPRQAMMRMLASADVALVPLGMPLPGAVPSKLYEAMGAGLPVVLAAAGEAAQIVESAGAGIAVRPGDVDGLVRALRRLVADPGQARQMGTRGRAAAVEHHDRRAIARRFIGHLESALGG